MPASPDDPAPPGASPAAAPLPSPPDLRALRFTAVAAVAAHLAARAYFVHADRFFACEDDAYRTYLAVLLARGGDLIGRLWPPGHMMAMAAAQQLGVPAAWSGILIGTISVVALGAALADLARSLAPADLRPAAPWAALLLVAASPLTLVLGHASLAEPLECALVMIAAALVARRARGGPRRLLAPLVIAMFCATWVRYESWAVALALPAVLYGLRRSRGARPAAAAGEALLGAIPLLGPLAWLVCQAALFGDPLAFINHIDFISPLAVAEPVPLADLRIRAASLILWAPATLAWSLSALGWLRDRRGARWPALLFAGLTSLGVLFTITGGREHAAFMARLSYGLEVALWPLAALGLSWAVVRVPRVAFAGALATLAVLAVGVTRPPEIMDQASAHAGLLLRRGDLEAALGPGTLLVERVPQRPPFGWAALGVLWGRWERTIFATRRIDHWEIVEPAHLRAGKSNVVLTDISPWLDVHHVTAAWVLTPGTIGAVLRTWPHARVTQIGAGVLVVKESP